MLIVLLLREPAGVVAGPEEDLLQAMAFPVLETLSPCLDYFVGKGELVQIRWGLSSVEILSAIRPLVRSLLAKVELPH